MFRVRKPFPSCGQLVEAQLDIVSRALFIGVSVRDAQATQEFQKQTLEWHVVCDQYCMITPNITDPLIACPDCGTEFRLTETLARPLLEATRREALQAALERERALDAREATLRASERGVKADQAQIEQELAKRVEAERVELMEACTRKAREDAAVEMRELRTALEDTSGRLEQARTRELALLDKERKLADREAELELSVKPPRGRRA